MDVLVGYASAHGSTRGVAERIAGRLVGHGLGARARSVDEIVEVTPYDAVVVGSAVHNGAWLPGAVRFLHRNADLLRERPVWLFTVSAVGETSSFFPERLGRWMYRRRKEPKELAALRREVRARGHHAFAGAIQRDHWPLPGHVLLRTLRGTYGDHRDWADIDAWSHRIARELTAGTSG